MAPAAAQEQPVQADPERVRALAELLRDPGVQAWLRAQIDRPTTPPPATAAPVAETPQRAVAARIEMVRTFMGELAAAAPRLPGELSQAWSRLSNEMEARGPLRILGLLAVFAALGFGLEWLFWWATGNLRQRMIAHPLDTVGDRLRAVGRRAVYGVGVLLAFAVGSIGAFLLFQWPLLLKEVVVGYLLVVLIVRLVLVLGRILLAPAAERFRVVPMATPSARFWFVWSAVIIGWFCFVRVTLDLLLLLGLGRGSGFLIGLTGGVVLVGLVLNVVWRHPHRETGERARRGFRIGRVLLSAYLVLVWLLLFTGSVVPFYIGVVLLLLPIAIRGANLAVTHILRPASSEPTSNAMPTLIAVALERGLRAVLLIGAAYLIAAIVGLDLGELTTRDTVATRLLRGVIHAVVIALLADLAWHLARTWIDQRIKRADASAPGEGEAARREGRLRTLLPILKNVLLVVLVAMTALMVLSALGVQVAPLVAGAGVVGIAIGFGAQTLVKDILSGMFFLLDDAFRVGEYIESGSIRGTVEAFSLRSIKLRHHRGALHTIPFGALDKITNYSRDWVIDKMTISVTYGTDLDKVKKLIKQVGKELQADPEFAPIILETLKMQGVERFGEYAIELRLKMMTKPGQQFVIRRRGYAMIKKLFAEHGIEFASPMVTVSGGGDAGAAAAAQKAVEMAKPAVPAA